MINIELDLYVGYWIYISVVGFIYLMQNLYSDAGFIFLMQDL